MSDKLSRRALLGSGAMVLGTLATPSILRAQALPEYEGEQNIRTAPRNVMGFRNHHWKDHFKSLRKGAILCDTYSRALHYWSEDERTYLVHPCSVPMSEEFTRRGYTEITLKRFEPTWIPTPSMRERDPSLPEFMPAGPGNPLGTHAMYLEWPAYLIHGTHDTRKIGRRSSSGCVGLYNEQVAELFPLVAIGCQVRLI